LRTRKDIILEVMNSMLASAQLEAKPGITFKKFLLELEFLREYPKDGEGVEFTPAQIKYIRSILNNNFRIRDTGNEKYYIGQGLLF
jgi:hypothetical protein